MIRNLDITALRAFHTVAEVGGVTRAAGQLNLTQSAVSMQIKRLEEMLDLRLFDREGRSLVLTADGENLMSYAGRMLTLNDEVWARFTSSDAEGTIALGVPHDILYPALPTVLRQFSAAFPRVQVDLISAYNTTDLHKRFSNGEADIILTTEADCLPGGIELTQRELVWCGAIGGNVWKERPLPLAFSATCIFGPQVRNRLDHENVPWRMAEHSRSSRSVETIVSADLAVHAALKGFLPPYTEVIDHGGALPELLSLSINLYRADRAQGAAVDELIGLLRRAYAHPPQTPEQQLSPSSAVPA